MDGYHQYKDGSVDVQVTRVDDRVTIGVYRDGELLVQMDTTRGGAMGMVQKILGALH